MNDSILPTQIEIISKFHKPIGNLKESIPLIEVDDILKLKVKIHRNLFFLEQNIQVSLFAPEGILDLKGVIKYQSCNNKICTPIRKVIFYAPLEIIKE